jgi:type VII secretion-associated serine protease mycosin
MLTGAASAPAHADTVRDEQWHLEAMHAEEMWETSTGRGITVAVIDSGVDDSLADLRGQVLDGVDYSGLKGDEHTDQAGHGTGMAALIAATGARGKASGSFGLAPGVKILPIKMPYPRGNFDFDSLNSDPNGAKSMARAIRHAADSDAQIISISMAAVDALGRKDGPPEIRSAVRYALNEGKLIFAGVGNKGDTTNLTLYPAATPGVVGVGAVDEKAKPIKNSQWGPQVDLAAPGKDMVRACPGGTQLCEGTGTSGATALASASAALIWSQHPEWTNNQVLRVLMQTASGNEDGISRDDVVGYGVIRPRIALKTPGDPGPADVYPIPDFSYTDAKSPASKPKPSEQPATAPPAAADGDSGSTPVWIGAGIGAAALLGAAITVPVLRNRRRNTSSAFAPSSPHGLQTQFHPDPTAHSMAPHSTGTTGHHHDNGRP